MNWQLMPPAAPPAELLAVCQGPLLARLLAQRGFVDADSAKGFLNPDHYAPAPASDMVGVVRAARMLRQCQDRGGRSWCGGTSTQTAKPAPPS